MLPASKAGEAVARLTRERRVPRGGARSGREPAAAVGASGALAPGAKTRMPPHGRDERRQTAALAHDLARLLVGLNLDLESVSCS